MTKSADIWWTTLKQQQARIAATGLEMKEPQGQTICYISYNLPLFSTADRRCGGVVLAILLISHFTIMYSNSRWSSQHHLHFAKASLPRCASTQSQLVLGIEHLLLAAQLPGTHWVMICVIRRLALTVSDVCLKLGCFHSICSALEVSHFMLYINSRLTDLTSNMSVSDHKQNRIIFWAEASLLNNPKTTAI